MAKASGKRPGELELPVVDNSVKHVWRWFLELYTGDKISYTEIMNWSLLMREHPTVAEIRLIQSIDHAYRAAKNEANG